MGSSRSARFCRSPPRPITPMWPNGGDPAGLSARARQDAGKHVKTTISDKAASCPLDHVNRQFKGSKQPAQTCFGSPTSPMSRPGPASSTSPSSSTPMPAGSWAGGPRARRMQALCSMRTRSTAGPSRRARAPQRQGQPRRIQAVVATPNCFSLKAVVRQALLPAFSSPASFSVGH